VNENFCFFALVSISLCTIQPKIRKTVSFHEPVDDLSDRAREIATPPGKSILVNIHGQLIDALGELGLTQVSEDHFETVYVGLMGILMRGESSVENLNCQSVIEQVITGTFFQLDQDRPEMFLPLDELLDLISDNLTTITDEVRTKFFEAVRERYQNLSLSDQRMINSLYGPILSQIEF